MSQKDTRRLAQEFDKCQKMLTALGDTVRQKLLLQMMAGGSTGVRVADVAEKLELTRPAVSHHMQILKDAGLVRCRRSGKCIYYYFDRSSRKIDELLELLTDVRRAIGGAGEPA